MSLRAVIVDDEPLAREGVELMLADHDVEIVAVCANAREAIRAITEASPDVVFLDIHMPDKSGFDVIEAVGIEQMPAVVFLTAYDEYAVQAFRANAADYLLKPLDGRLLAESLMRVRRRLQNQAQGDGMQRLKSLIDAMPGGERMAIRERSRVTFVEPAQISRIAAAGDYVSVFSAEREILVRDTIGAMYQRLREKGFARIHRSHIVNTRRIRSLETSTSGSMSVTLEDGTTLPVGRSWRDSLIAALNFADSDA